MLDRHLPSMRDHLRTDSLNHRGFESLDGYRFARNSQEFDLVSFPVSVNIHYNPYIALVETGVGKILVQDHTGVFLNHLREG